MYILTIVFYPLTDFLLIEQRKSICDVVYCILFRTFVVKQPLQSMAQSVIQSLCDFSFGMLFMSQLLFTAIMFYKGQRNNLQRMMFWFMLYLLLISLGEFCYFYFADTSVRNLASCETDILEMTVVPCALFVIIRLTTPRQRQGWLIAANALAYYGAFFVFSVTGNMAVYDAILVFTIVYSVGIMLYGYYAVKRFNRQLREDFSDEELSLHWLKYILFLYAGIMLVWTADTMYATDYIAIVYNVAINLLLGLSCYFVYRQEDMLKALNYMDSKEKECCNVRDYDFEERFKKAFDEENIYLNPKLNVVELAMAVGTNRTYISNYLNRQLHTTFYEYVNHWRVMRAEHLLTATKLGLEEVAYQSGFNSLSSFRRYFTSVIGKTPAAYRKEKSGKEKSAGERSGEEESGGEKKSMA